jgi:Na+:H+ antiporter, NhaA family
MTQRTHVRIPVAGRALSPVGSDFVSVEVLGGVLLLGALVAALVWSSTAPTSYAEVWAHELTIGLGRFSLVEDLGHWVNDGLMTLFFLVVGLEIKRELVRGELRDRRTALVPAIAALGGMAVPAILFTAANFGGTGSRGWAIPMATDIAFAVVVLAALGSFVPKPLKLFLLTLAIVDDIGAIVVIAIFYSDGITIGWLLGALAVALVVALGVRLGVTHVAVYILPAFLLWLCLFESGVHPTIAGVTLGLLAPAHPVGTRDVIGGLEHRLHPWSSFVVVPLFALANAGMHLDAHVIRRASTSAVAWGIVAGLVLGKPIGITLAASIATRTRIGRLPDGITFRHLLGAGCLAGIGFTVSLFIAELSFKGTILDDAKLGILVASVASALLGTALLLLTRSHDSSDAVEVPTAADQPD